MSLAEAEAAGPDASSTADTTQDSTNGPRVFQGIRDRPVTLADARDWLESSGDDPDDFHLAVRSIAYGGDKYSNKMSAWPKFGRGKGGPKWPVVQFAEPVAVNVPALGADDQIRRDGRYKLSAKASDPQIGFRVLADGELHPFHDDAAMALFVEVCRRYQPDKITLLGDYLDLPSQSRFAQEESFARTTQLAINRGHRFLAELRAVCPDADIVLIEGNHDARMQRFIQANALAAFGLKQADAAADDWPVMSIPFLLRLDDLSVRYVDAYPAATDWDNDLTRNIHGTRANSKGSTMSQYVHELPHVNTWAGHTHRAEVVYRTVLGARGEPIESYAANPGVLCRIDGAVPSVHSGIGSDGRPAQIVEDWQQGFGLLYYSDSESWPQVHRIRNGATILDGRLIQAPEGK